ncbi:hypothetical protein [Photobacterium aquimaris]|uniref:Uncharacterized protein n=1 Tax=Photobacterium aquimaris TaxID=512643 RepID=A0A1B8HXU7_9GAMM|nr:hypothetical protein [Photobacterium aquimaris]OBU19616.1 hypothetical protein AYY21_18780 [Photobacterium aquimaris]PQJ41134.1 hypothetical protein BTN98_05685 [Photobacterium aquimaris]SMY15566.1 hypothetical protein PAQU9191_00789 [Photobacterium aquimaris]
MNNSHLGYAENINNDIKHHLFREPFSQEKYKSMRDKTAIIWDFQPVHSAWKALDDNLTTLKNYLINHKKDTDNDNLFYITSPTMQYTTINIDRLVNNYLASYNRFIDLSGKLVRNNSTQKFKVWDKYRTDIFYKKNKSYRITYALRNYSIHHNIPISSITVDIFNDKTKKNKMYLHLDTNRITNSNFNCNKEVSSDFKSYKQEINLITLFDDSITEMKEMYDKTIDLLKDKLIENDLYLRSLFSEFNIPQNAQPIIYSNNITEVCDQEIIPTYLWCWMKKDIYIFN